MNNLKLKTIEMERASRIAFMQNPNSSVLDAFMSALSNVEDVIAIANTWTYARALNYHHPGQSKELYLAHPLRVATMYIELATPLNTLGVMTALIHNIQEVTNITEQEIEISINKEVASAVTMLTVNRDLQWDENYKELYYKQIYDADIFVQQVKILDKLDNLFLLCMNPSDDIRKKYLSEIEKWVLPMSETVTPTLTNYIHDLIINNRMIGYVPIALTDTRAE